MEFIRRFIEQKIADATGALVQIGDFSFSPFSGIVEIRDLVIPSLLTIKRIEAKIAVARALKQEIVVRALAIEGPQLTLIRRNDGTLNLPSRPKSPPSSVSTPPGKPWEFEANKVLLVGGRVEYRDDTAGGYRASMENLTGSIEWDPATSAGIQFIFAADSLGRRDKAVELGEARLLGKLPGVTDLPSVASAAIELTLKAGTALSLAARSQKLSSRQFNIELDIATQMQTLLDLLPPGIRLPFASASGKMAFWLAGAFDPAGGVHIDRLDFHAADVSFPISLTTESP